MAKVMLVEDDATMFSLLRTLFEIEGFDVIAVQDFKKVVAQISNDLPDIVIMDVHLQGANGLEILVELRENSSIVQPKVIISSGMGFDDEAKKKGADEFVLKPYMPDELINKVKTLLEI